MVAYLLFCFSSLIIDWSSFKNGFKNAVLDQDKIRERNEQQTEHKTAIQNGELRIKEKAYKMINGQVYQIIEIDGKEYFVTSRGGTVALQ